MGILYNLGHKLRSRWKSVTWLWQELTGTEAQALRAEEKYGEALASSLADRFPRDDDQSVRDFVGDMGAYLVLKLEACQYRFRFRPVRSRELNAFAFPGGLIFVTRFLLKFCEWNQEEVAFVLGHEMGHVACRHARDKLLASVVARTISLAHPLPRGVVALADAFVSSEYSKDSELEADLFAVGVLRDAGFDPQGAIRFLERLDHGASSDAGPGLFSTHPPFRERVANIAEV